jgi:hypothetical protein
MITEYAEQNRMDDASLILGTWPDHHSKFKVEIQVSRKIARKHNIE